MIIIEDWKNIDYDDAWDRQKLLFETRLKNKSESKMNKEKDIAVFCEHPHVYTLGKSGKMNNMLASEEQLKKINAKFVKIDRGGDITYHGPGQIVVYPVFDLEHFNIGLKQYIYNLEEAVILFLKEFGIKGERLKGATGVWIDPDGRAAKICAIGVKASRYITMHGLALNINTDLSFFSKINPCGFVDKGVTSLEKELGQKQDFEKCKKILSDKILKVFIK